MAKAKIVSCASWKGGVGKSTLSASMVSELARMGNNCLIIDTDSNRVMTNIFGKAGHSDTALMLLNSSIIDPINCAKNIDIIPSEYRISQMNNIGDKNLFNGIKKNGYEEKYDYIFIDPPGTWNALTRNALRIADVIVLPGNPSDLDLEPIELVIEEMKNIDLPQQPEINAVLNMWDVKKNQNNILKLYESLGEVFCPIKISSMKGFRNLTEDIYNYKLRNPARKQILDLMVGVGVV